MNDRLNWKHILIMLALGIFLIVAGTRVRNEKLRSFYEFDLEPALRETLRTHEAGCFGPSLRELEDQIVRGDLVLMPTAQDLGTALFGSTEIDGTKTIVINVPLLMEIWPVWQRDGTVGDMLAISMYHERYHLLHHKLGLEALTPDELIAGECEAWRATLEGAVLPLLREEGHHNLFWSIVNTTGYGAVGLAAAEVAAGDANHPIWQTYCRGYGSFDQRAAR